LSTSKSLNSGSSTVILETPTSTVIVTTPANHYCYSNTGGNSSLPLMSYSTHHVAPLVVPQYTSSKMKSFTPISNPEVSFLFASQHASIIVCLI
jgi:hypothetical protein